MSKLRLLAAATTLVATILVVALPTGTASAGLTPPKPTGLVATGYNDRVLLTWTPYPGATGHVVQRSRDGKTWKTVTSKASAKGTYTVTGLTNGVLQYFRVATVDTGLLSTFSTVVSARPRAVPDTPSTVTASGGNLFVRLSWKPPVSNGTGKVTGYRVQRLRTDGTWRTIDDLPSSARTTTLPQTTRGAGVSARVIARNVVGLGVPSATRSALVPFSLSVGTGSGHTCALRPDTTVRCWGINVGGEVGTGDKTAMELLPETVVDAGGDPLTGVTQLSVGGSHSCARLSNGTAMCWGQAGDKQLGDDTDSDRASASPVLASAGVTLTGVRSVAAGDANGCAVLVDGTARCWGYDYDGTVGNDVVSGGDAIGLPATVVTAGGTLTNIDSIEIGTYHACARLKDATLACWGWNSSGQVGAAGADPQPVAVAVTAAGGSPLTSVASVSLGREHTCAVLTDRTAVCWGSDDAGQLANGDVHGATDVPLPVLRGGETFTGITSVSATQDSTCAVTTAGQAWCWGNNDFGELGDATGVASPEPVRVLAGQDTPLSGVTQVSISIAHSCARAQAGRVWCWGAGDFGELGTGDLNIQPYATLVDIYG